MCSATRTAPGSHSGVVRKHRLKMVPKTVPKALCYQFQCKNDPTLLWIID